MGEKKYEGLLAIGDPHVEGRVPGFRKDDYPEVVLEKLEWCLDYARQNRLLPMILGDLFQLPRNNQNWVLGRLIEMFDADVIGIYGNHDTAEPELTDHDSLSLLVKAGRLRLVDASQTWKGVINGRHVVVGGSSYRQTLPESFAVEGGGVSPLPLIIWLAHHDVGHPSRSDLSRSIEPQELPGVDIVINGHIHRQLEPLRTGQTTWFNPGSIVRRNRSDATREHVPSVLRIDISAEVWKHAQVTVPHQSFEEVFHEAVIDESIDSSGSAFVAGLAELQTRRTDTGAGLMAFIEANVGQFQDDVAEEILALAIAVTTQNSGG